MFVLHYKREALLRSFAIYNAVIAYLFMGNAWKALGVTLGMEGSYTLSYVIYLLITKVEMETITKAAFLESFLSIVFSFAYVFIYVTFEYVFDAATFIGHHRYSIMAGILIGVYIIRIFILAIYNIRGVVAIALCFFLPALMMFVIMLTNEGFWADAHTLTVCWMYLLMAIGLATLPCLFAGYFAYLIHGTALLLTLIFFWNKHSERDFSNYIAP